MVIHIVRGVSVVDGGGQVQVLEDGSLIGQSFQLNFIAGANVSLDVATSVAGPIDITINATGGGGGGGNVSATTSSLNNQIVRYSGTTGLLIKNSNATIDDAGNASFSGTVTGSGLSGVNTGDQTIALTGDVTGSGTATFTATIPNQTITFAKFQNVSSSILLGRSSTSAGSAGEIAIGSGLTLSNSTLANDVTQYTDAQAIAAVTGIFQNTATITLSGTATSITASVADNSITYALFQQTSTGSRILANTATGAGSYNEASLSDVLDMVGGAAQGDILYRGASVWERLPAGTSGSFLQTQGTGQNPQWAPAATGSGYATIQEEGTPLTARATMNFIGSAITAADDSGSSRTNITTATIINAVADLSAVGYIARTGAGTVASRTISAASNKITITNSDGVGGDTTIDVAEANLNIATMTGILLAPHGGTGNATYATGDLLYANTQTSLAALTITSTGSMLLSGTIPAWGKANLSSTVTGILTATNGGTGNAFFLVSGPTTTTRTFTFPNASATVLTTNALVTVAQGGTGFSSGTSGGIPYFDTATSLRSSNALTASALLLGGGAGGAPLSLTSLGTTTQVLHGNASGIPTWASVSLTSDVSGILTATNGGTANAFFAVTGPTTTTRTFTFPDASATVLTTNALVTVAQGGTGLNTIASNKLVKGNGTSPMAVTGINVGADDQIDSYKASITTYTSTSVTLSGVGDLGKVVEFSNGSAITVTLPNSVSTSFCCTWAQVGAGQVTFTAASGATLRNRQSHNKAAGQWAMGTLYVRTNATGTSAEYVLAGDTST